MRYNYMECLRIRISEGVRGAGSWLPGALVRGVVGQVLGKYMIIGYLDP